MSVNVPGPVSFLCLRQNNNLIKDELEIANPLGSGKSKHKINW